MISSDEIIKSMPEVERFFEMSQSIFVDVRQLKGADGRYLWDSADLESQTLLGFPFVIVNTADKVFRHVIIIDGVRSEKTILALTAE